MKPAKTLAACMLLVCAIFAASAAKAGAEPSEWTLEGETFAELEIKEEEVSLKGGPLSFEFVLSGVKATCNNIEGGGTLFQGGTDAITGTLSSCEVPKLPKCKITKPVPLTVKSELFQTGGAFYDKFEALKSGGPLAVITTEECILPKEIEVTGTVAAEVPQEELVEPPIKFSAELSKKVNESLKAEEKAELKLSSGGGAVKVSGSFTPPSTAKPKKPQLRNRPTALCYAMKNVCPFGETFALGTNVVFVSEIENRFTIGTRVIKCTGGNLTMPTGAEVNTSPPLKGTLTEAGFENCEWENEECPVVPETPRGVRYETTGGGAGTITLIKPSFITFCAGVFCRYDAATVQFTYAPGNPAEMTAPPQKQLQRNPESNEKECAKTATWEGLIGAGKGVIWYKTTEPAAAWYISS